MAFALFAALLGTAGYGTGSVLQAAGAARGTGPRVMRQPVYMAGLACDGVAWLASLVALQRLPLFAVQALLAGSLAVTVLLSKILLQTRLRGRDVVAILFVTLALAVVAGSSGVQSSRPPPGWFAVAVLAGLSVVVSATLLLYREGRPIALAVAAGVAFSGAAVGARAADTAHGWLPLLADPVAWTILGFGVTGAMGYARALERATVGPVTAVLWVVEVLVPGVLGVLLLGDGVRAGWTIPALVAVLVALAGCVVLATSPGQPE